MMIPEQESNIFMKYFDFFWVLLTLGRCELAGVSQQVQAAWYSM